MKQIQKILLILGIIFGLILYLLVDAFLLSPSKFTVRYQTLTSDKIPQDLNNTKILYVSDIYYGNHINQSRLQKLVDTINRIAPDAVVFGGDIYAPNATISTDSDGEIATALSSIKAPLGKFAVLGDQDCATADIKSHVLSILQTSNFEVISNSSVSIHNGSSGFITLVGLENELNSTPDVNTAYANVSSDNYVITVCHTPDTASLVPLDTTNYFLAGHSLGGQAYYLLGAYYAPEKAVNYLRGKHLIQNSFMLDITNGVGTIGVDMRFLSPAEVVCYTLKSTAPTTETNTTPGIFNDNPQATPTPTPESTPESTPEPTIEPTPTPEVTPTPTPTPVADPNATPTPVPTVAP